MRARRLTGLATLVAWLILVAALPGAAAEPSATAEATRAPAPVISSGDPRSDGSGPGLVGSPALILLGVVAVGLGTVVVTAAIVRARQRG